MLLDRRVVDHQVVAHAVDRVARLHLDREVAARARADAQVAGVAVDDARRVEHPVVQPTLVDVVALGVVPVLLGGEKPLEEVDALEPLDLLAHGLSSSGLATRSIASTTSAPMPMPERRPIAKNSRSSTSPFSSGTQVVVRVRRLLQLDDLVDPDHHLGRDVLELDRHRHDEAVREIDRRQDHRVERDASAFSAPSPSTRNPLNGQVFSSMSGSWPVNSLRNSARPRLVPRIR